MEPQVEKQRTRKPLKKPDVIIIKNIQKLLDFLEDKFETTDTILFRGQHTDWPLLPKIARITLRFEYNLPTAEQKMMEMLKLRAISLIEQQPETDWDWLAIAQHSGMATRLLDWTTNPLAALWFAIEKPPLTMNGAQCSGILWAFKPETNDFIDNPKLEDPFQISPTKVFRPKHLTRRIIAQSGWFTAHAYNIKNKSFVPLEKNQKYRNRLFKMSVPPEVFADLRCDLDRLGFNAATLFADLDSLCRDIQWQHSLLQDEKE